VADERRLPFEVKAPNRVTREAMAELEAGGGKEFATVADLMADLYADD
jgi:DNA-damage-inducible protein J